eukprot:3870440-Alexandrium_andersonii.AAC.1
MRGATCASASPRGSTTWCLAGAPCETFSRACARPPGPRPFRDLERLCGPPKDWPTPEERGQVHLGAYFALVGAQGRLRRRDLPSRSGWARAASSRA